MRLEASPNPYQPFRICLPRDFLIMPPELIEGFTTDDFIPSIVSLEKTTTRTKSSTSKIQNVLAFDLPKKEFTKEVLQTGLQRNFQTYNWSRDGLFPKMDEKPLNVIVEFSSPNVAKPFHMGHFRSTIIGNFVANIHQVLGHNVTRINFLGDWGTQFGLLAFGLKGHKNIKELKDPIQELNQIYVEVNQKAEKNPDIGLEARKLFSQLEAGDAHLRSQWADIRAATIKALTEVYQRLGITFDHYHGEAMYGDSETKNRILTLLKSKNLLTALEDGRQVIDFNTNQRIVISKSDGSSLYITRDIAAALDRIQKFHPHQVIYVVEQGQGNHFSNLFKILSSIIEEKSELEGNSDSFSNTPQRTCEFKHIMFGRIQGMSTRKGTAVFLTDILEEATQRMLEKMKSTETTKVRDEKKMKSVAETLGISAVLINDVKQKRNQNYKFDWDMALHAKGDSGILIQGTHSRLCNLLKMNIELLNQINEIRDDDEHKVNWELLSEPEAIQLILRLAQFDENLAESYQKLEPSVLVKYLFRLCHDTSRAVKVLRVKGADKEVAVPRYVLFQVSQKVLHFGMTILGLKPLEEM